VRCVSTSSEWVHMGGWSYLVPFAVYENSHLPQKPELTCRSPHEDFFPLDDNVYVPPDLGILDEDANGDAAVLLALN
jgi:hypothetical protein